MQGITIEVIEISNQIDQVVINTQDWKTGIYIATLKIDGKSKESIKFTIVK